MLLYSVIFFLIIQIIFAINPCQTPDGKYGDCRPIKQCQSLYVHFEHPSSERVSNYIQRSYCGFEGDLPKVCCRTIPTQPINTTADTIVVSSNLLPNGSICGLSTENKISGGVKTDLDEFPWMALLDYDDLGVAYFDCGGALINNRYVLTAAHCVKPNLARVRLGEYDIETNPDCVLGDCAPPPVDVAVEEKIFFGNYNLEDSHDIALLRLKQEVEFSDFIRPICLPSTVGEIFNSYENEKMTVAGWGLTEKEVASSIKLKVQVPVRKCARLDFNYYNKMDAGYICAGGERGKDSCNGDSGGPLMALRIDENKDIHWYAAGVLSSGPKPCGQRNKPGIYTRVSKYLYWIIDNLKP